ncbi:uncharacterized protein BO97DRAFT_422628 [Aspergillus homomorphus CBS 101889]|uniref:Uncharacterized protein n=1 Tax=Aspergillus homomorphus (strain CBS 101889) TaxID=1450537 RepID=A0A395I438_ASPHC|nr:hypothetical protein BO97DRAFT_422628 [Aspergillus homomorphus CBS 101889]RAL14737.1 hypothetical protein BO97DRAFT_422628 [Aspergillus homomorphus CBS 101889]
MARIDKRQNKEEECSTLYNTQDVDTLRAEMGAYHLQYVQDAVNDAEEDKRGATHGLAECLRTEMDKVIDKLSGALRPLLLKVLSAQIAED